MTNKETLSSTLEGQAHQHSCDDRLPPINQITNMVSPNRQQLLSPPPRTSTSSSQLFDSDSPGSYNSYSSAEYSPSGESGSVEGTMRPYKSGELQNDNISCIGGNSSKKRVLLKSINTNSDLNTSNDYKFSHGLLSQVHKMQSLLEEYQHSLTALELEKADKQQEINRLDKRLKAKSETEERYKEEIWDLELKNQDLLQKLEDLSQCYTKSKSESAQLKCTGTTLSQEIEQLKAMKQAWEQKSTEAREEFEIEIINLKKALHSSKLEKEALTNEIQNLTVQYATSTAATNLRHIANEDNVTHGKNSDNLESSAPPSSSHSASKTSPEAKANKNTLSTTTEVITLKQSLEQAHQIIHTIQEKLDREREERIEVDKLLREAQETIENFHSNSHNNSAQWYTISQSPTHGSAYSNTSDVISPTSTRSIHSNHSGSSNLHQNVGCSNFGRQFSRKSNVGLSSGKSYRKKFAAVSRSPYLTRGAGKSLCDELSQAGSIGNFTSFTADFDGSHLQAKDIVEDKENNEMPADHSSSVDSIRYESDSSPKLVTNDQQGINRLCGEEGKSGDNSVKTGLERCNDQIVEDKFDCYKKSVDQNLVDDTPVAPIELRQMDLPSISNHEIYSSFSSKTSSARSTAIEEEVSYNEEIKFAVEQHQVHYGSLLKKPESYIYKSRRELDEEITKQKMAVTKAMLANALIEKTPKVKIGLGQDAKSRKRESVDDKSVSALTRIMMGDWMWKYTRKVVGSGISENRHRRFFWIHPYTQTLYWSSKEPGSENRQSNTKSVLVESFAVLDGDSDPTKLLPPSILIKTPSRGLKIQCMNMVAHQAWIKSLNFLLDGSQEDNDIAPKLSSLDNVSKQHYLHRKMSLQKPHLLSNTSTVSANTKVNGSGVVDKSRIPFKFEPLATVAIDDLMPPPSPTLFTL